MGRSLGIGVGTRLRSLGLLPKPFLPSHLGTVVATACLAHDIGNPPFGHAGEEAIRQWFSENESVLECLTENQKSDFQSFEGNAQGFRILARLQHPDSPGLQLTCSTLASFAKYPWESVTKSEQQEWKGKKKKHGFFQSEKKFFEEVANEVGLIRKTRKQTRWCRHPFAYLVEAADDICYSIIDLEDGFRLGQVSYNGVRKLLKPFSKKKRDSKTLALINAEIDKISYMRAKAISSLIEQVVEAFISHRKDIMAGVFEGSLLDLVRDANVVKKIKEIDREHVYTAREVLEIEVPGFDVISGLLSAFVTAVNDIHKNGEDATAKSRTIVKLLPKQFLARNQQPPVDLYERLIRITDFISGMTDSYAVALYKQIAGISLPQR